MGLENFGFAAKFYWGEEMGHWLLAVTIYRSEVVDLWLMTDWGNLHIWRHLESNREEMTPIITEVV